MVPLLLWLLSFWAPDLARLGHDEFAVREAETARCDCWLLAALLPARHDDPEVNCRVRLLRTRNLKYLDAVYAERRVMRADFDAWATLYLFAGRSRAARDLDVFERIHAGSPYCGEALFRTWPSHTDRWGFLYGSVRPGEYEDYLDWLDFHLGVAPAPREK